MIRNLNDVISSVDEVLNNAKLSSIEEVFSKTKTYAEIATKKSAERLEISRKKVELLDAKSKLTKAYEKFGKIQFDVFNGEEIDDDELNSYVEEINLLKSRIDFINEEIEEAKAKLASEVEFDNTKTQTTDNDENVEVIDVDAEIK